MSSSRSARTSINHPPVRRTDGKSAALNAFSGIPTIGLEHDRSVAMAVRQCGIGHVTKEACRYRTVFRRQLSRPAVASDIPDEPGHRDLTALKIQRLFAEGG